MNRGKVFSLLVMFLLLASFMGVSSQSNSVSLDETKVHSLRWMAPESIKERNGQLVWDIHASVGGFPVSKAVDSSFPVKDGSVVEVDPLKLNLANRTLEINVTTEELVYSLSDNSPMPISIDGSEFDIDALALVVLIVPIDLDNGTNTFQFLIDGGDLGSLLGDNTTVSLDNEMVNVTSSKGSMVFDMVSGVLISAALHDNAVGVDTSITLRVPTPPAEPNWADSLNKGKVGTFATVGEILTLQGNAFTNDSLMDLEVLSLPETILFTPDTIARSLFVPDNVTAASEGYTINFNEIFKLTVDGEKVDSNAYLGYIMQLDTPLASLSDSQFEEFSREISSYLVENGGVALQSMVRDSSIEIVYSNSAVALDSVGNISDVTSLNAVYSMDGVLNSMKSARSSASPIYLTLQGQIIDGTTTDPTLVPVNPLFVLLGVLALPIFRRRLK